MNYEKRVKKFLSCVMVMVIILISIISKPIVAQAYEENVSECDALNLDKELLKTKEYIQSNQNFNRNVNSVNEIKLEVDRSVILEFEDGSTITYRLEAVENSLRLGQKTYKISKTYFIIIGNVNIYMNATCNELSDYNNYITNYWTGYDGTFSTIDVQQEALVTQSSSDIKPASWTSRGQFTYYVPTLGDYYTKSFYLKMNIARWGSVSLTVL